MKTNLVLTILILASVLIGGIAPEVKSYSPPPGACPMPVDFDGVASRVSFGANPVYNNLSVLSVCLWVNPTTLPDISAGYDFILAKMADGNNGWLLSAGDIPFFGKTDTILWSDAHTSFGQWMAPSGSLSVGSWQHLCVTIDRSSTANDPIIYVNAIPLSLTETYTPSGAIVNDSAHPVEIGGSVLGADWSFNGKEADVRIYNRILSASEVLEIYNSKSYESVPRGLVFQMRGYGAAGVTVDGTSLGATNYVADYINGAVGTPAGSPILRADANLNCNP